MNNKENVKICKCKFLDALKLVENNEIDIAEYKSSDGFYKYCIRKMQNEIVIYTKNTNEIVVDDILTCYKYSEE